MITKLTWLPMDIYEYAVLTEFSSLTQEIHFNVSDYQARLANKGFSCFGILSSIELFVGSIRLRRTILIMLSYIQANFRMCKI